MVFETLYESAGRGELLIGPGGLLRYHRRRDGQVTIHEILVLPAHRRQGTAQLLLCRLLERETGIACVVARCPADLCGNAWYQAMGFELAAEEETRTGRRLNVWRLPAERCDARRFWRYDD